MEKEEQFKVINVRIETELKKEYQKFCIDNDVILSKRIIQLIREDLKKNKK